MRYQLRSENGMSMESILNMKILSSYETCLGLLLLRSTLNTQKGGEIYLLMTWLQSTEKTQWTSGSVEI